MVLAYGAESDRKLGIPGEVGWFFEPVIYHYLVLAVAVLMC